MKVLLIEPNREVRELIEFTLESQMGAHATACASGAEAEEVMKTQGDFVCVVSPYRSETETEVTELVKGVRKQDERIPIILITKGEEKNSSYFKANPPFGVADPANLYQTLSHQITLAMEKLGIERDANQVYSRVRSSIALRFGLLKCDLYVKIGESKYVKVMREGDLFDLLDFNRFEERKVEYFYILASDAYKVMGRLIEEFTRLSEKNDLSFESQVQVSTTTLEMISDFSHSCGFNAEVQRLTKLSVDLAVRTIQKNPKLKELYTNITVNHDRYLVSHSVLLAHVSCGIASMLGWTSENTFYKLSLAAFLHDMTLDEDKLARIQDLKELNAHGAEFTDEEKKRFRLHPDAAAQFLSNLNEIPSDVHLIVREHHELPDGTGFPHGINHTKISPLSAVFIVAENLIHFQTQVCNSPELSYFISSLPPSFTKGQFREITNTLIQSMIENERP